MTAQGTEGGRRGRYAAVSTSVLLVVGVTALALGLRGQSGPPQPTAPLPAASTPAPGTAMGIPGSPTVSASGTTEPSSGTAGSSANATTGTSDATNNAQIGHFVGASAPVGIEIPSIGVSSTSLVDLGIAADGTISVPGTADEVGFYSGGPTPGQLGPAVLAAHVDSTKGPGIFFRLGAVKPGATIKVTRADHSVITFVVDKVASYPKEQFPTDEVYHGDFTRSEIRLVTCGGTFDKVKHYLDNVVVFGHLDNVT